MATAPTPPNPPTHPTPLVGQPLAGNLDPQTSREKPVEWIRLVSHSTLFYWWPVWAIGFAFAGWTAYEDTRMAHIPRHTKFVTDEAGDYRLQLDKANPSADEKKAYHAKLQHEFERGEGRLPRMSHHAGLGTLYCILLLIVITITNVPLRGLWSVVVIITVLLLSVIFAIQGWWGEIFKTLGDLHIYIGFAGYLFLSTVLMVMWVVSTFVFDRQVYIIFTPGQMRVCEAVGAGENVYDTAGMQIEKHRTDLFRHTVLGLGILGQGTGDVTVKTSGAQAHTVELKNVWRINQRLRRVEAMQRERQTVQV